MKIRFSIRNLCMKRQEYFCYKYCRNYVECKIIEKPIVFSLHSESKSNDLYISILKNKFLKIELRTRNFIANPDQIYRSFVSYTLLVNINLLTNNILTYIYKYTFVVN